MKWNKTWQMNNLTYFGLNLKCGWLLLHRTHIPWENTVHACFLQNMCMNLTSSMEIRKSLHNNHLKNMNDQITSWYSSSTNHRNLEALTQVMNKQNRTEYLQPTCQSKPQFKWDSPALEDLFLSCTNHIIIQYNLCMVSHLYYIYLWNDKHW